MNVYVISRKDGGGYDEVHEMVVVAKNMKHAGDVAMAAKWGDWVPVRSVLIIKGVSTTIEGVVSSQFNAG